MNSFTYYNVECRVYIAYDGIGPYNISFMTKHVLIEQSTPFRDIQPTQLLLR